MCIHGGYKAQTVTQIANIISSYDAGEITLRALRIYFASLVSVASREAAKRSRMKVKRRGEVTPRFLSKELSGLTGLSIKAVQKEIRSLKRAGLLRFSESEIVFEDSPKVGSEVLRSELSGKRSPKRPVPIPRTVLRFLAKTSRASTLKTTLAYVIRGLTITRQGEITGSGSVKATWIAGVMNLSERSVRSARSELLELGWITDDENSFQRKLNRDGAYFTINFSWKYVGTSQGKDFLRNVSEGAIKSPVVNRLPVDNSFARSPTFAPHQAKKRPNFAPPYKNKKTSSYEESKNQKTQSRASNSSGVFSKRKGEGRILTRPTIKNVQIADLEQFSRCDELYQQACKLGLVRPSEASYLNWFGAAIRAKTAAEVKDPVKVFMGILKKNLWMNITQEQEERARLAIKRYNGKYIGENRR